MGLMPALARGLLPRLARAFCSSPACAAAMAAAPSSRVYPEQAQAAAIKPASFYEAEAARRHYFFYVDLQGRLFLEDVLPKTVATCLKAPKALDAFYKVLARNDSGEHAEYPFLSSCGWETNFVTAADTPVVFTELEDDGQLRYAATLGVPFDPESLRLCPATGRLYHRLRTSRLDCLGLLRSQLAERLAGGVELHDEATAAAAGPLGSFDWRGARHDLFGVDTPFADS